MNNIKDLKKELNLSNADLAKCFDMTYGAYANSTAKERYESAILSFYKLAKKGWEKNKRKNLISDNQTTKHEPKQLIIHGVVSSNFYCFKEKIYPEKRCKKQCGWCECNS